MESWTYVFRHGIAPALSVPALQCLAIALDRDDPRVIQGATTCPPPLLCNQDMPVRAADPIAFAVWQGLGLETVGQVETVFAAVCDAADELLGDFGAVRPMLNWWDDSPRETVRPLLLAEVRRAVRERLPVAANLVA